MKKLLCLVLCLAMLAGCGGGKTAAQTTEPTAATTTAQTTAATTPIPPRDPAYNVGEVRIGDVSLSEYKVVLPENPSESVAYAADEFIKYIALATGKTLEKADSADKAIYIGCHPDEALGEEGFDIKVVEDDLIISGNSSRGTLYGVYTFLEEYIGWRWYDREYEKVKVSDFIQIPLDTNDRQVPILWVRSNYCFNAVRFHEFAVKLKNNQVLDGYPIPESMGGSIAYDGGMGHTFNSLVPMDEYYDEHPEYFTWNGHSINGWGQRSTQLCLTNPEVLDIVIKAVRRILEANPDARIVSVSQNDNHDYCICESCARIDAEEGSHAGTLLRFVNAVAEDIAEDYPNVMIDTFAYQYTRTPPKITVPRENVQVRLCSIECCFSHPIEDGSCRQNKAFMADLKGWSEICDNLAIWDYTTNFHNFCAFQPNFNVLPQNIVTFYEHGAKNVMELGNYIGPSGEFDELRSYLLAKLLWDPYMTEEEYQYHINDFLEGYYGAGWETVRRVIDLVMAGSAADGGHYGAFIADTYVGFEPDDIEKLKTDWAAARELASDDAQRLHFDRSYLAILMAERAYYVYNQMFDRTYPQKARELLSEIGEIAKGLGVPHAEIEGAW